MSEEYLNDNGELEYIEEEMMEDELDEDDIGGFHQI